MMRFLNAAAVIIAAGAAQAQTVSECQDNFLASAWILAEPWELNTRTFANGQTRLAVIDAVEPGAAPFHLLVLSPPYDELGGRQCRVISYDGGFGFGWVTLEGMQASYDPARGLSFRIPVKTPYVDGTEPWMGLNLVLNQATGALDVWLR
jgi:hypothetical protein